MKTHARSIGMIVAFITGIAIIMTSFGTKPVNARPSGQFDDPIEQGRYIANIARCISCHTPQLAQFNQATNEAYGEEEIRTVALFFNNTLNRENLLAGGRVFNLGPSGTLTVSNITPDEETGIGSWTDAEIKASIQTGVNPAGRRLHPIMPAFNTMAESDLDALIAYLRSVEPVSNEITNDVEVGAPPARVPEEPIVAPEATDLSARGDYLTNSVMGCAGCHTPTDPETGQRIQEQYLSGRQPFEGPYGIVYAGNITPHEETGIGNWTEEEIKRVMTTGVRIDGRRLGLMPWQDYSALTPEDLNALVHYLENDVPVVDRVIPSTALEAPYVEIVEGIAKDSSDNDSRDNTLLGVVSAILVLIIGGGILMVRRRSA